MLLSFPHLKYLFDQSQMINANRIAFDIVKNWLENLAVEFIICVRKNLRWDQVRVLLAYDLNSQR